MRLIIGLLALVAVAAIACDGGDGSNRPTTPTSRPVPSPVAFAQEPLGNYKLGDPTLYGGDSFGVGLHFAPLPNASVDSGRLGGSIYQIEIPDKWNGRLVLWVKSSFNATDPNLTLFSFPMRSYLIRNGFAWGESSGSSNAEDGVIPEETAALWDFFAQKHGRPQWTYLTGDRASAVATRMAAGRYPDRFDGAVTLCGIEGDWSTPRANFFVAGAFVAGVTQAEFDASDIGDLINTRIRPALADPTRRARFEDIAIELMGGPRPFAHEGLELAEERIWGNAAYLIRLGYFDNLGLAYHLRGAAGVSDDEFNAAAVRRARGNPALFERFSPGANADYDLKVPLLTINTTGNAVHPISNDQVLRRKMTSAGSGDLLVQRTVRSPEDCTLSNGGWDNGIADLVAWVEQGKKPEGEDLLADDLSDLGRAFTHLPALGSPEADAVPGANERVTISGTLTFDGQPLTEGEVNTQVLNDGMVRSCMYEYSHPSSADPGRYEFTIAADTETPGCGAPGAQIYLIFYSYSRRQVFISEKALDWPADAKDVTFDTAFSTDHPAGAVVGETPDDFFGTTFDGVLLDATGAKMPPGTLVEAYIGDTRCGRYALPVVATTPLSPNWEASTYRLHVSGPGLLSGCTRDAPVSFRINGKSVAQTAKNAQGLFSNELDLQVKE